MKGEDTKEELIKSIKKALKMQTLIKKWDDLSIDEVQSIFGLRSEVFIVEQECPFQDVDGRDPEADHLLLYENNIHFKLIGYFKDNNMIYYFNNENLPEEILKLNNLIR